MEDLPEKLRRNVMFIGTLILSTWIFDLKIKVSETVFGFIDIGNITPIKIWISLLVALVYFSLRHIYSDQVKSDFKLMKVEHQTLRIRNAYRTLNKRMRIYFKTGLLPTWLPQLIPDSAADLFPFKNPMFKIRVSSLDSSCAAGAISLSYKVLGKNGEEYSSMAGTNLYDFTLSRHERMKIFIASTIRTATFSKAAVDVLAPFIIASTGLIICVSKLLILLIAK
ncbi:hypothetical protein [Pseudomonas sp. NA-150]|uniref:hypothetical protein n=1 Tax=Pseudomonas sp. NA-150 TaxID=3367525 RepID=UPI0037CBF307